MASLCDGLVGEMGGDSSGKKIKTSILCMIYLLTINIRCGLGH